MTDNREAIILMDLEELQQFVEIQRKLRTNFVDYLEAYRTRKYSLDNGRSYKNNEKTITILGMDLDENWTFGPQVDKTVRNMQLVRLLKNLIIVTQKSSNTKIIKYSNTPILSLRIDSQNY